MDFVHHERLYDGRNAATRTDDHMPADMMRQARGHGDDYVHHERLYDGRYAHTKTDDHMSASMMRQLHGPGVDHVHHERLYDGRNAHTRTDDHMSSEMMRQLHGPAVDHVHHERLFDGSKVASRTVTHHTQPKLVSLDDLSEGERQYHIMLGREDKRSLRMAVMRADRIVAMVATGKVSGLPVHTRVHALAMTSTHSLTSPTPPAAGAHRRRSQLSPRLRLTPR